MRRLYLLWAITQRCRLDGDLRDFHFCAGDIGNPSLVGADKVDWNRNHRFLPLPSGPAELASSIIHQTSDAATVGILSNRPLPKGVNPGATVEPSDTVMALTACLQ
jgi:hypothetical protein